MASRSAPDESWVSLGRVARAHGVRGGLRLHLWNEEGDALREGLELELRRDGAPAVRYRVRSIYGPSLVKLEGVDDRDAAERLRGAELFARRSDFPEPDEDEAYLVDLVGAEVVDQSGAVRGTIIGFAEGTAQPLAEVEVKGRDEPVLVPFVEGIVVAIEDGDPVRVVIDAPVGLLDPENAG